MRALVARYLQGGESWQKANISTGGLEHLWDKVKAWIEKWRKTNFGEGIYKGEKGYTFGMNSQGHTFSYLNYAETGLEVLTFKDPDKNTRAGDVTDTPFSATFNVESLRGMKFCLLSFKKTSEVNKGYRVQVVNDTGREIFISLYLFDDEDNYAIAFSEDDKQIVGVYPRVTLKRFNAILPSYQTKYINLRMHDELSELEKMGFLVWSCDWKTGT